MFYHCHYFTGKAFCVIIYIKLGLSKMFWRDFPQPKFQSERNYSGPLSYRQRRETNNPSSGISWFYFLQCLLRSGATYLYFNELSLVSLPPVMFQRMHQREQLFSGDALKWLQQISVPRYICNTVKCLPHVFKETLQPIGYSLLLLCNNMQLSTDKQSLLEISWTVGNWCI